MILEIARGEIQGKNKLPNEESVSPRRDLAAFGRASAAHATQCTNGPRRLRRATCGGLPTAVGGPMGALTYSWTLG